MPVRHLTRLAAVACACVLITACGSSAGSAADGSTPTAGAGSIPSPTGPTAHAATTALSEWPEFGLNPQRSDSSERATGITSANVAHLHRLRVSLPGTVDSSPVYLHTAHVHGAVHETIVVTTTYGKTLAIDAQSGQILWTFTPPGYAGWAGSAQITTASPLIDPDGRYVYAASPNGLIHKLSLADGSEDREGIWPVSVTRDPTHEKLGAALNIDGPDLVVATSGYFGDIPPYQGHVVLIERSSGRVVSVFNTLCSNRRELQVPSTCSASDSAILSRGGPVVEPGGQRILIDTGNGPWNGSTNFGDSVLELTFPGLTLRQSFTPVNQEQLNRSDTDLGSSAPALLGENRVVLAGKDGIFRALEALAPERPLGAQAHSARRRTAAVADPGRWRAVHRPGRLAPRWAHDDVRGRRTCDGRVCSAPGTAVSGVAERDARNESRDGGRSAVRVRPGSGRNLCVPARLAPPDRHAPRLLGPLEQPDRRGRPRGRARGGR